MPKGKRERVEFSEKYPVWARMINKCLIEKDWTQKKLASESKIVSEATIATWLMENGAEPKAKGLLSVAQALETSVDYLLGKSPDRKGRADVNAVQERLGLSPSAQDILQEKPEYAPLIDFLICNEDFIQCLKMLALYSAADLIARNTKGDLADVVNNNEIDLTLLELYVTSKERLRALTLYEISMHFNRIAENYRVKRSRNNG